MLALPHKIVKKKQTKRDVCRNWGIPETVKTFNLRYQNPIEKGILWFFFSLFIRKRDVKKYGTCISCGREITVESCDAGHFAPTANCGFDLLFDPLNVNAECSHCNAWDEMHLLGYAKNLDKRYGEGTAENIKIRRECYRERKPYPDRTMPRIKDWTRVEYEQKLSLLKKDTGI